MSLPAKVLVVDDNPQNVRLLEAVLEPRGYTVCSANSGEEALRIVAVEQPDLVLLDVVMPGLDGHEVCRRLRADTSTAFLPIVMITASNAEDRVSALNSGADDFLQKPFDHAEILARIKSLLRIKAFHDTIQVQARQLEDLNRSLGAQVREQVAELERLGRLRRFLSPRLADVLVSAEGEALLESHRRQIAVVCCRLHGFAEVAETSAPEEALGVLHEYYAVVGEVLASLEGSVGPLNGDALTVFFNDPLPVDDPAADAVGFALTLRERVATLRSAWQRRGFDLGLSAGAELGYATMGTIGFADKSEYGAIGPVVHASTRLCVAAEINQILIGQRLYGAARDGLAATDLGELVLPGAARASRVFAIDEQARTAPATATAFPVGDAAVLTSREREVVTLIARGLTNRQIAEALVIAEPTAVRHVANILNKLDLSSRARVAVWAIERGLHAGTPS
jgi:adenylate cyclase